MLSFWVLQIWNAESGACLHTLVGHTSTVRCLAMVDGRVVSGSRDATLRIWRVSTGDCLHVLAGHVAAVRWYVLLLDISSVPLDELQRLFL